MKFLKVKMTNDQTILINLAHIVRIEPTKLYNGNTVIFVNSPVDNLQVVSVFYVRDTFEEIFAALNDGPGDEQIKSTAYKNALNEILNATPIGLFNADVEYPIEMSVDHKEVPEYVIKQMRTTLVNAQVLLHG